MNIRSNIRRYALVSILAATCMTTAATQHRQFHRPRITTVVVKPSVMLRIDNRLTQKERFQMAVAYLNNNKYLTVKRYAKMTGLSKRTAEAELDAFVSDRSKSIVCVIIDKKKMYTKR